MDKGMSPYNANQCSGRWSYKTFQENIYFKYLNKLRNTNYWKLSWINLMQLLSIVRRGTTFYPFSNKDTWIIHSELGDFILTTVNNICWCVIIQFKVDLWTELYADQIHTKAWMAATKKITATQEDTLTKSGWHIDPTINGDDTDQRIKLFLQLL